MSAMDVRGADLVEGDLVGRHAMHTALGLGEPPEDPDGDSGDGRLQVGSAQPGADMAPVRVPMAMSMLVSMLLVMRMVVVVSCGDRRVDHLEAAPGEDAVIVTLKAARDRGQASHAFRKRFGMLRKGVEQGGGKHVPCHPADGIEMDMHHGCAMRPAGNVSDR